MRVTVCILATSLFLVTHAWLDPAQGAAAQSSPAGQSDKSKMDKAADQTKPSDNIRKLAQAMFRPQLVRGS